VFQLAAATTRNSTADGTSRPSASSQGIFLRLPGQWNDGLWNDASLGTEIYYNLHRWYEQQLGRYSRPDPLSEFAPDWPAYQMRAFNTFAYAQGRPTFWSDPAGEKVTGPDILNCLNPATCGVMAGCRYAALKRTRSLFGSIDDGTPGNAFQHCFWTCCMSKRLGSDKAKDIARGHEESPDNPLCHALMDLSNNATGAGSGPNGPQGGCGEHCQSTPLVKGPIGPCCPIGQIMGAEP
jgi:RHS repeat-associated protein